VSINVMGDFQAALKWFPDSPEFGSWRCLCSLCGEAIRLQDGPPLRIWRKDEGMEARLHRSCLTLLLHPPLPTVVGPFIRLLLEAP
jgi:hypothetical protein